MINKRGLILILIIIVFIISINPVSSARGSSLTCQDGTKLGYCNLNGNLCAHSTNIISTNDLTLKPNIEYLFFAQTYKQCPNPKLIIDGREIKLTNTGLRLTAQFTSKGEKKQIKVLCSNVETQIEKKYLGEVKSSLTLYKEVIYCGGSFQENIGRVMPAIVAYVEEVIDKCVSKCDYNSCLGITDEALKKIATDQYAVNCNDINACKDGICAQKVVYFNCKDESCDLFSTYETNPSFLNGRMIYMRDNTNTELKRYKFISDNSAKDKCDIQVQDQQPGIIFKKTYDYYIEFNYGTIISHLDGKNFVIYASNKEDLSTDCTDLNYYSGCFEFISQLFGTQAGYKKDCSSSDCELLRLQPDGKEQPNGKYPILGPKADLLCGYEDKWYLCDKTGIKTFDNGKKYLCDGGSGIWAELS